MIIPFRQAVWRSGFLLYDLQKLTTSRHSRLSRISTTHKSQDNPLPSPQQTPTAQGRLQLQPAFLR